MKKKRSNKEFWYVTTIDCYFFCFFLWPVVVNFTEQQMLVLFSIIAIFAVAALGLPTPQYYGGYNPYGGIGGYQGGYGGGYPGGYGNYGYPGKIIIEMNIWRCTNLNMFNLLFFNFSLRRLRRTRWIWWTW